MLNGRRQPSLGRTSRVNREVYARFCERLAVRFRGPTRHCVKKDRKVCAVRMMKVGPLEQLCKKRLQTAVSGLCRKTVVVNVTVKRRGLITSGVNERGECE